MLTASLVIHQCKQRMYISSVEQYCNEKRAVSFASWCFTMVLISKQASCIILGKFFSNPGKAHWKALKRVLRYLSGTIIDYGIIYRSNSSHGDELIGASDANWAGEIEGSMRTRGGFVFSLAPGADSWRIKLKNQRPCPHANPKSWLLLTLLPVPLSGYEFSYNMRTT